MPISPKKRKFLLLVQQQTGVPGAYSSSTRSFEFMLAPDPEVPAEPREEVEDREYDEGTEDLSPEQVECLARIVELLVEYFDD